MNEPTFYEYTDAAEGQRCLICRRTFRLGETIKKYDGYRLVCISAATCVRKLRTLPAMAAQGVRP